MLDFSLPELWDSKLLWFLSHPVCGNSLQQHSCCCLTWVASDSVRPHRRQPPGLPSLGFSRQEHWSGLPFLLQCMKVKSEREVAQSCPTLATPWTAAHQAPPSMGVSRQKYWSGVPLPSPYSSPRKWKSHSQFANSQWVENAEEKGLSRLLSGKESTCQCRKCKRLEFDPWVRQIPWRRKWQPTPVSLSGKSHGQRTLVGYSPWDCKGSKMTKHAYKYIRIWPRSMWDLSALTKDGNCTPCLGRQSLNPWTTREILVFLLVAGKNTLMSG